jgi:hypothetical protein
VTGLFAQGCFVTGFIIAWLLRTGYVTTQISWASEQTEQKVRYWQSEAIYARGVADDAQRQLAAVAGHASPLQEWPGPGACGHRAGRG